MKKKQLSRFIIGVVATVLLNVLAAQYFFRIDLTADKRYTISDATIGVLETTKFS
jgi:ABC-2 type transport system permease protein